MEMVFAAFVHMSKFDSPRLGQWLISQERFGRCSRSASFRATGWAITAQRQQRDQVGRDALGCRREIGG